MTEFGSWGQTRPGWDEYGLALAATASIRGDCIRRKVGAALMDENHIIRGLGYNGSVPGGPSCLKGECPRCLDPSIPSGEQYGGCIEKHAEPNCWDNSDTTGAKHLTMYITCPPCSDCKDFLFSVGVQKVVWPEGHLDLIPKL